MKSYLQFTAYEVLISAIFCRSFRMLRDYHSSRFTGVFPAFSSYALCVLFVFSTFDARGILSRGCSLLISELQIIEHLG